MIGGRWVRRNWWAVLAVLPIAGAMVAVSPNESYQTWRDTQPREAVLPGPDGWVSYAGVELRLTALTELTEAELFVPGTTEPFGLPAGLAAWQATLTITAHPDPDALVACEFELEDESGRRFGESPEALEGAAGADGSRFSSASCQAPLNDEDPLDDEDLFDEPPDEDPPDQDPPPEGGTFETVAVFTLPSTARPVALRVSDFEELPAYARFDVGLVVA